MHARLLTEERREESVRQAMRVNLVFERTDDSITVGIMYAMERHARGVHIRAACGKIDRRSILNKKINDHYIFIIYLLSKSSSLIERPLQGLNVPVRIF